MRVLARGVHYYLLFFKKSVTAFNCFTLYPILEFEIIV